MKDLGLKILAVVITLVLYTFVNSQSNQTELTLSLPVKFKNLPDSKFILLPVNRQVQVTLRGPAHKISPVASGLFFEVTLPSDIENKLQLNLTSDDLNLPLGLEAYNINPSKIDLILDDIIKKNAKIQVLTIGQLSNDLLLSKLRSLPDAVEVKGPSSEIKQIEFIETLPLELSGIKEGGETILDLRAPSSSVSLALTQVKVDYEITSLAVKRQFLDIPLETRVEDQINLKPIINQVTIEVSGPGAVINNITQAQIVPYIKINKENSDNKLANIKIDLPPEVDLVKVEPNQVKLVAVN